MRIFHRISTDEQRIVERLGKLGIECRRSEDWPTRPLSCIITEDDHRWEFVATLLRKADNRYYTFDRVWTEFTRHETDHSTVVAVKPSWHHGYPQPEDQFGYREITYDLRDYCPLCGTGKRQISAFRMKKEPVWGRRSILQLNWVFDEYFVKPDVWEAVFRPIGVEKRPVILHKTGVELQSVVQLVVSEVVDLNVNGLTAETCSRCKRNKYLPVCRGLFPSPLAMPGHVFRSREYFGTGGEAFNAIFVSNALYSIIRDARLRGAEFYPCANT